MKFRFLLVALALLTSLAPPPNVRAQPQPAPIVRSIDVQYAGAAAISKEKILANMRTRVGRPYDDRIIEEDIRNLYATGNISNVRIFGEPTPDGVKVIVVVQAKAQITEVILNGVSRLKPSRIRKQISAKAGEALNEAALEADRQKVLEYYTDRGFTEADVRYSVELSERAGTARVIFNVNEGGKLAIKSVEFEGNDAINTRELKKTIKSKPKGLLTVFSRTAGKLDSDQLNEDTRALRELYQSKGYIDANINTRVDRTDGRIDLTFLIKEGPQYQVGKVTYSGAQVLTIDEVQKNAKIKTGAIYSPQAVRGDIKTIRDLYGARGYVDFEAGASVSAGAPRTMDVAFTLDEGVQSYVEHIDISGNIRTKDKVIRREIAVAPGDIYNTVRVDASRQRLLNLQYFSRVEAYHSDTLVPGRKDLKIFVQEQRTGSFNFGAGFSSIDNLLGFVELTQGNFDITRWPYFTGGGQKFRVRAQYGTRRKDFIISLTEPYFLDYKLSLTGELFYRDAAFVSRVYNERRYGFDLGARKPLTEFSYLRFGYRLEQIGIHDIDEDASDAIKQEEGERLKSQLGAGIVYDTRDDLRLTRRGHRVEFNTYVAGGFLGGNTDIYGLEMEASKYFPLPYDTILIFNGAIATVSTWAGGDRVPIFDRLFLGGANNLRGFSFRDVGPKDEDGEPIGGKSLARFTAEYTFPIVERVRGAVFYDIGFVNAQSYDFGSSNVNSDVGVGVRLDLPIGPIRIDYGIPLRADEFNDSSGRFNFNIGYQF
ncbi:MAG: outer membrane protein assembly factor BamA [Verrucomicrobiota bacterium]|nr:outer membrane protein assembly factor BamA [Verrucomicrobiota bacterium]